MKTFTPHNHVNEVLHALTRGITDMLGDNVIGIYLFGSLTYEDFNPNRSDIDLLVIVKQLLSKDVLEKIKNFHEQIEKDYPSWKDRIECSYTPLDLFQEILPPKTPRPYYGAGIFYPEAPYGNEWIINNYLLYQHSIALTGPDFKKLVKPIDIADVQKASIQDLFKEWEPKINNHVWLQNSHYQSYLVLNLCRILHTVLNGEAGSKSVSAAWVKKEFPEWKNLIQTAEDWEYGKEMKLQEETIEFIKFTIDKVNTLKTSL